MKTKQDILKWWEQCGLVKDEIRNDLKDFIEKTKNTPIDFKIADCQKVMGLDTKKMKVWTKRSRTPISLYFLKDSYWVCVHIRNF